MNERAECMMIAYEQRKMTLSTRVNAFLKYAAGTRTGYGVRKLPNGRVPYLT